MTHRQYSQHFLPFCMLLAAVLSSGTALACDELEASDLNSRIQTGLILFQAETTSEQNEVDRLQTEFANASNQHTQAIDNNDDALLQKACDIYEEISQALQVLTGN